jgi:hypothetical protein
MTFGSCSGPYRAFVDVISVKLCHRGNQWVREVIR